MKGPIGAPVGALSDKFSLELWANQACARRVPTYLASWPGIAKPLVIEHLFCTRGLLNNPPRAPAAAAAAAAAAAGCAGGGGTGTGTGMGGTAAGIKPASSVQGREGKGSGVTSTGTGTSTGHAAPSIEPASSGTDRGDKGSRATCQAKPWGAHICTRVLRS
eukprot:1161502-Pelagomonas_calceolata.AAC.6